MVVITGLHRTRIALVTALMLVVALAARDVFDRFQWWLLLAPTLVGASALLTVERRWLARLGAAAAATLVAAVVMVLVREGDVGDLLASFGPGYQRILSTDWPSPDRPDLVGTVAVLLAVTTGLAAELARRDRLHLAPLAPVAAAHIAVIALSAPNGVTLLWLLPLAVLAIAFAALRPGNGATLRERLLLLRGERRLLPVSVLAIGLAAGLALPIALIDRADPRRNEPAERTAALLDPIEATLALQSIDPPIDLHEIRIESGLADRRPVRWRTAALEEYDGRRWAPDLTLRPIGRRLAPPSPGGVDASITFLDDDLQLVPLPGAALTVDADIETDAARAIVRLIDRPEGGEQIRVSARIEPGVLSVDPGELGARDVDETSAGLAELAAGLVDQGGSAPTDDLLTQLRAIETTMRNDFVLRSDASGGGLQRALVERFLRDTQRGNAEQFSTAFVLLARSLGVDTRIATGFQVASDRLSGDDGATTLTLTSADARIWPEVRVGEQWVAFDPVPPEEASDAAPPASSDVSSSGCSSSGSVSRGSIWSACSDTAISKLSDPAPASSCGARGSGAAGGSGGS